MKTLTFHKMVASGNDFIVVDNRSRAVKDPAALARELCPVHTSVGADGILLYEPSRRGAFKMRIVNSDGSEAEACGNGFRCIALYASKVHKLPVRFSFESLAGIIEAEVLPNNRVRVQLPDPKDLKMDGNLTVLGNRLHYSFINTGVPHTVIFTDDLEKMDVNGLGRAIRQHPAFKPKGTNVNFVKAEGSGGVKVRTYERGVEAETLACGTGSTASAIISAMMGTVRPPVAVTTRGGETLFINFRRDGKKVKKVTLEGEARLVFEGSITIK